MSEKEYEEKEYEVTLTYRGTVIGTEEGIEDEMLQAIRLLGCELSLDNQEIKENEVEEIEEEAIYTLCLIEDHTCGMVWGDHWRLHAKGCAHVNRSNVDWKWDFPTMEQAIDTAFGDFIDEHAVDEDGNTIQGVSFEEASRYLRLCPCALKVAAKEKGIPFSESD